MRKNIVVPKLVNIIYFARCSSCKNTSERMITGATFYADVRRDGHYRLLTTCKGMLNAKMFYGGMVLFFEGISSRPTDSAFVSNLLFVIEANQSINFIKLL